MRETQDQYTLMTETPVSKLIIKLGIPTTISMLVTSIYNMADTYFVSKLGNSASGAVGIVFALMAILQAVGFMFGQGSGSKISRLLGAKKGQEASSYASTGFFFSFGIGAFITIVGLIFITPLMRVLGSTNTILPYAKTYGTFILLAAPMMISSFVMNNILRFEGKAMFSMIGLTIGGLLNMVMDPIFMFVLDLGIAGAGLATALSQVVSFMILLSMFMRGKTQSKITIHYVKESMKRLPQIMGNGLPSMVRQGLGSVSNMILNHQAAFFGGDAAVAAMSIVGRIGMFIFAVGLGIGQGFQPVAGYNYGAKKYDRVRKGFWFTFILGEIVLGSLAILGLMIPEWAVRTFRDDAEVLRIGVPALKIQFIGLFLQPLCVCTNMVLQSTGKSTRATFTSMLRNGIYYIPTIFILPSLFGIKGVIWSQFVADAFSLATIIPFSLYFLKELKKYQQKGRMEDNSIFI